MKLEKTYLQEQIQGLEKQRDQLVAQINQAIGEINGRIAVFEDLLEMAEKEDEQEE
jgi:hypothetical protein